MTDATTESITFTHISWVSFSDKDIQAVVTHVGVPVQRVQNYLGSSEDNDGELFKAFHFITGCYPCGKGLKPKPAEPEDNPHSMGCMVPHKP